MNNSDEKTIMITQTGLQEWKEELAERYANQPVIADEIKEAKELGDLRENDIYKTAMQKKELNDTRIDELEYMISIAQVVEQDEDGSIGIGNQVTIVNKKSNKEKVISLVGKQESEEADPREGKVSIDSPVGAALIGHKKGDTVEVELPMGKITYEIKKVA